MLKYRAKFSSYIFQELEHSLFIVQVLPHDSKISATDMVRVGRLAPLVRKRFVIANPLTASYYFFE